MDLGAERLIASTFSRNHESRWDASTFAIHWWEMSQMYNERENCSSDVEQCICVSSTPTF